MGETQEVCLIKDFALLVAPSATPCRRIMVPRVAIVARICDLDPTSSDSYDVNDRYMKFHLEGRLTARRAKEFSVRLSPALGSLQTPPVLCRL